MPWHGRWPWPQVLTLSLTTSQGGIFWFTLIDTYSTGFGLVIITLFMCLGISFCYGERGWGSLEPALVRGGVLQPWGSAAGWSHLRLLRAPAGIDQFCQDIRDMICRCPPWCSHMLGYFKVCWVFFTPCLLLVSIGRSPEAEG